MFERFVDLVKSFVSPFVSLSLVAWVGKAFLFIENMYLTPMPLVQMIVLSGDS
jgi:hypothetical protein